MCPPEFLIYNSNHQEKAGFESFCGSPLSFIDDKLRLSYKREGVALNPDRGKVGGDHLETSGAWSNQIKMKGRWKERQEK